MPSLPFGLDESVIADGDVDPAVDPHPDAVGGVVGAAELEVEADPLDQVLGAVGDAVAVVVVIGGEVGRVQDVERAGVVDEAARAVHPGEDVEPVGLAVAVGVEAAEDAAPAGLGVERAVLVDADEDLAGRRRGQAGRDSGRRAARRTA